MKLWAVEHFVNISSTILSSLLGWFGVALLLHPPKSGDKNVEEMFTKCSTARSFIRTEMTTYRIGTLGSRILWKKSSKDLECGWCDYYPYCENVTNIQGRNCRGGRGGNCPPTFWQNRRRRRQRRRAAIAAILLLAPPLLESHLRPCCRSELSKTREGENATNQELQMIDALAASIFKLHILIDITS